MLTRSGQTGKRPPGPRGPAILSSLVAARREPLVFARRLVEKYGDVVSYRLGPHSGYLLRHPDHVRHVLSEHHRRYGKSNYNYEQLKPVLGNGLITSEGEEWVRARRQLHPLFHNRRIEEFAPVISQATSEMLTRWDEASAQGQAIDVSQEMAFLTMRVIGEVVFDLELGPTAHSIASNFSDINEDVAHRFRNPFSMPRWIPTPRNRAFKRALRRLEKEIEDLIRERRSTPAGRSNLVEILDPSPRDQKCSHGEQFDRRLRDQAMTLILAGYETTAALLAWTWFLLAVHPKWTDSLREELEARLGSNEAGIDHLPSLQCTRACIEETLRLYPPVWIISRIALDEDEIDEYQVPAGTVMTISAYLVHRHASFWAYPDVFNPERFLERPLERRHPFSYLPFGGGPRQCIGSRLAVVEAMLVLARVLRRYDPRIVSSEQQPPDPLVTLRPTTSLRATPRLG